MSGIKVYDLIERREDGEFWFEAEIGHPRFASDEIPVFSPVIGHLGFDPVWFWMMFLINFTLGGITPPIGYTNFVFKSVAPAGTTMGEIMRAAWPIVFIAMGCIVLMCVFLQIVTWLPGQGRAGRRRVRRSRMAFT